MGKGDTPRPVDPGAWEEGWNAITWPEAPMLCDRCHRPLNNCAFYTTEGRLCEVCRRQQK